MKNVNRIFCVVMITLVGCNHPDIVKRMRERPEDVRHIATCLALYTNIMDLFPQSKDNTQKYPALFDVSQMQKIVLTQESEVFVTFVGERASKSNTLGWYSYDSNAEAAVHSFQSHVIFPHISNSVLTQGDTRSLGRFPAGTVIGFYLIVGGWNPKYDLVEFSKPKLYTDASLNKNNNQQAVIFREQNCNDIVVAFEDTDLSTSDKDFNDILFKVSDNDQQKISSSFDVRYIPTL